jgi:amino acid transporter
VEESQALRVDRTDPPAQGGDASGPRLQRGSLNLRRIAFVGLAYFALAPVIYLNMGLIESSAGGPVMPLVFLVITIGIIPTAISFAIMNNRRPSAGSGYTWLWESMSPSIGLWLGWMLITTYVVVTALYPIAFAVFFNALLQYFGIHTSLWTSLAGGFLAIAIGAYMTHSNIKFGARMIGILTIFEAGFIAVLSVIIVIKGGALGHFSAEPFNPGAATAGFQGLGLAAVFAFLAIAGVDSIAPVAEESDTPRRLIPLATILITLMAGLFWTFTSYGFAIAVPVKTVEDYVSAGQITPVFPIAHQYIGAFDILVPITGLTAAIASLGASIYASSRLLFAVAREGFIPARLARLHPTLRTPWTAELTTISISVVALVLFTWWQGGPASAYGYLGQIFVFFVLVSYIFVNLANFLYHWRRKRDEFHWVLNGVVPFLGVVIDGYILYQGFFVSSLAQPFKTGGSIVTFSVTWAVLGILWALWWRSRRDLSAISLTNVETDAV